MTADFLPPPTGPPQPDLGCGGLRLGGGGKRDRKTPGVDGNAPSLPAGTSGRRRGNLARRAYGKGEETVTEKSNMPMTAEEFVIELLTSQRSLTEGRAGALSLLGELRGQWAREVMNLQMTAHETRRPSYHMGQPCHPGHECHVRTVIELADPDVGREKERNDREQFL